MTARAHRPGQPARIVEFGLAIAQGRPWNSRRHLMSCSTPRSEKASKSGGFNARPRTTPVEVTAVSARDSLTYEAGAAQICAARPPSSS
ncbi:hypothetical protein ACRAWD_30020 [Caulobacter segnis]